MDAPQPPAEGTNINTPFECCKFINLSGWQFWKDGDWKESGLSLLQIEQTDDEVEAGFSSHCIDVIRKEPCRIPMPRPSRPSRRRSGC